MTIHCLLMLLMHVITLLVTVCVYVYSGTSHNRPSHEQTTSL